MRSRATADFAEYGGQNTKRFAFSTGKKDINEGLVVNGN
ncbi:hypothetical protein V6Z11_A07G153300 [Gossypium hirsutum]